MRKMQGNGRLQVLKLLAESVGQPGNSPVAAFNEAAGALCHYGDTRPTYLTETGMAQLASTAEIDRC